MKFITSTLAALVLTAATVLAAGEGWLTDAKAAQTQAKKDGKFVLLDFTGSDWCPPCIKLHKEVIDSAEFKTFAKKSLVPVELDFPRKKQLPADLKKTNNALKDKYKIEGFPTLILLNGEGKELWRQVGYGGDGAKAVIAEMQKAMAKK